MRLVTTISAMIGLLLVSSLTMAAESFNWPNRSSEADWQCEFGDGTTTNHQRYDTAVRSCIERQIASPEFGYDIQGGRYHAPAVSAPDPDPIPDPDPVPDPDPIPDPPPVGGGPGWSVDTGAPGYFNSNELSGSITQYPYVDMFASDPTASRVERGSAAGNAIAWGSAGTGWNGERSLELTWPSSGEDNNGMEAKNLPASRRVNVGYVIRWNDTQGRAPGLSDSKMLLLDRSPGGGSAARFNAQLLPYQGVGRFPGGQAYQLVTPMRGVAWPQMPMIADEATVLQHAIGDRNAEVNFFWEFEADLDTGIFAWFSTREGGRTELIAAYDIRSPVRAAEGATPPGEANDPAQMWTLLGGPGGFPYMEAVGVSDRKAWVSWFKVDRQFIGTPAGFASDGSRPQVSGRAYQTGVFSGSPALR